MLFNIDIKSDEKYLYSNALLRSLEKKMLSDNDFINLLDVRLQSLLPSLSEYGYQVDNVKDFEELYSIETSSLNKLLEENSNDDFMKFVLFENDITNLKILLKSKLFLNKSKEDNFVLEKGFFEIPDLKNIVFDMDFSNQELVFFRKTFEDIVSIDGISNQEIEDILDEFYYVELFEITKKLKSNFLQNFVKFKITLLNIKNILRIKTQDGEFHDFRKIMVENSLFDENFYLRIWDTDYSNLDTLFLREDWYNVVKPIFDDFAKNQNLSIIEKGFDNVLAKFLKDNTKYLISNIEVVYTYYYLKNIELKNIKLIYIGKVNHLAKDLIIKTLRKSYV